MKQAFEGVVYDTSTALLLARNKRHFGIEALKTGWQNLDLFRTPDGRYFKYERTVAFFGEDDESDPELMPLSAGEAMTVYHRLGDRRLSFEDAFPDAEFEEVE
jgi:hypothetical protein